MGQRILFVEDNEDLAAILRRVVDSRPGYSSIAVHSFTELVGQKDEVLSCEIAFLDIHLGANQPTGIDAFNWLKRQGFKGRIYFLTAHGKQHPLVAIALVLGGA